MAPTIIPSWQRAYKAPGGKKWSKGNVPLNLDNTL